MKLSVVLIAIGIATRSSIKMCETPSEMETAILQGPRIESRYCPTCDEEAESFLCWRCKNVYICHTCAPSSICEDCYVTCTICYKTDVQSYLLDEVCESCEEMLTSIEGHIVDTRGVQYENLVELILAGKEGTISKCEAIAEEVAVYLESCSVTVDD